jgi:hypothetical protein
MATEVTVYLDDQLGELFGNAGVNIEGLCGVRTGGGQAEIHVLVEDLSPALSALAAGGIEVASELEVAVLRVEGRHGVMSEVSRKLGDAGVSINLVYLATNTRLMFGADELAAAEAALAQ